MNCSTLLSFVEKEEGKLPSDPDVINPFGHPPPPQVRLATLLPSKKQEGKTGSGAAGTGLIAVAYTSRTVAAAENPEEPFVVHQFDDPKESIACLNVFVVQLQQTDTDDTRIIVLFGTNKSRLLSRTLTKNETTNCWTRSDAWDALPLLPILDDSQLPQEASSPTNNSAPTNSTTPAKKIRQLQRLLRKKYPYPVPRYYAVDRIVVSSVTLLKQEGQLFVWVAYSSGDVVRLPLACLVERQYPNEWLKLRVAQPRRQQQTQTTTQAPDAPLLTVVPCPIQQASPIALLPSPHHRTPEGLLTSDEEDDDDDEMEYTEADELNHSQSYSVLVHYTPSGSSGLGDLPTMAMYTNEDLFVGRIAGGENADDDEGDYYSGRRGESELLNVAVEASTALVRGVVGVVKWGFLGSRKSTPPTTPSSPSGTNDDSLVMDDDNDNDWIDRLPFPRLHQTAPKFLYAGYEWHDSPRQIQSIQVLENPPLAATTDSLGRVCLVDLTTFQLIRLWKGVREATVCFFQNDYLAIHSATRRTVEVYKLRHGPRTRLYSVGRNAQLVTATNHTGRKRCYILHAATGVLERVEPEGDSSSSSSGGAAATQVHSLLGSSPKATSSKIQESTMRLRTLQQMLANTNVPCMKQHVLEALTRIQVLTDLATALDILATASSLEDRMGVKGADFHMLALEHCRSVLDATTRDQTEDVTQSPPVQLLSDCVEYHQQLIDAYRALSEFESSNVHASGANADDEAIRSSPKSFWAVEATSWIKTYQTVLGEETLQATPRDTDVLRFADFCKCCARRTESTKTKDASTDKFRIYLSDSTKTRREVLIHIFSPLVHDVFCYPVVNNILESLGVANDTSYIVTCFGEWFMNLAARVAAHKAFYLLHSPLTRWLQEEVTKQVEAAIEEHDSFSSEVALDALYDFCASSPDLVRAFLLAATARDAVSSTTKKLEVKTYGKVWKNEAVQPWESLLRKLRMCLLVSLRLKKIPLGPFPITVKNVESPDIFSVYQWVAHDELLLSHKQEEIATLERACAGSGLVFDPCSPAGDNPARWKLLQQASLAVAITEEERAEYLVDIEDDIQGALLLYLSNHNNPAVLVAHRALLLAGYWLEEPEKLHLMYDCVDALSALDETPEYRRLAAAVRLEVWQTCIRPTFRALFFGFDEIHELSPEVFLKLFMDTQWLRSIGKFALVILFLLSKLDWTDASITGRKELPENTNPVGWPEVKKDLILQSVMDKCRPIVESALEMHRAVVCGAMISQDFETLSQCVYGFYSAFDVGSLWEVGEGSGGDGSNQMVFLENSIIAHAETFNPEVSSTFRLDLDEMETLAALWSIDVRDVRTIFLLAMYEFGKDGMLEDFWSSPGSRAGIDLSRFVEDGLGIACRRLHLVLHVKRSARVRSVFGLLDTETTEWVRDQAEFSVSLLDDDEIASKKRPSRQVLDVTISNTHLLILRLMSMASSMGEVVSKETRLKLHSLSVLSGTLKKELDT